MDRRDTVKKFVIHFEKAEDIDLDLLELQLHSFYKLKNINFDEVSFYNDLQQRNFQATALDVAKKIIYKSCADGFGMSTYILGRF